MGTSAWEQARSVNVCICIPHSKDPTMEWASSLKRLQPPPNSMFHLSRTLPLDITRDELVKNVFKFDAEWLFFLDMDIIIPVGLEDIIQRLMRHNLPVVSALYFKRGLPTHEAMWRLASSEEVNKRKKRLERERRKAEREMSFEERMIREKLRMKGIGEEKYLFIPEEEEEGKFAPIVDYRRGELVKADVIGMGCCLINRKVFEVVPRPWFWWTHGKEAYYKCPKCGEYYKCPKCGWEMLDDDLMGLGEDFYFCRKIKRYGFDIYVDTSIVVEHEINLKVAREGMGQWVKTPLVMPRI